MGWRDDLRKGSWRGVPFHWKSAETELGRRTARHNYPQRDDVDLEDMGKIPREFTLEMYVVGPEYMAARDLLAEAFELAGSGTLVHPLYGSLAVTVSGRVRTRETTEEGGMARFTATFVQTGTAKYPAASTDTAEAVRLQAAALREAKVLDNFERSFSVIRQPAFVRDAALSRIQSLTKKLQDIAKGIPTNLATPGVLNDLVNLQSSLGALLQAPRTMAQSLVFLVNSGLNLAIDPLARFGLAADLFDVDFSWGRVSTATPSRRQDASNQDASQSLYKSTAVLALADSVADMDFDSYQDAVAVRDRLLERLDLVLETAADDLYPGLSSLRAAVVKDIAARGADLARVVSYTPVQTMPALLLAHQLYGDATQGAAIITRNKSRHPGFIPGGVPLEVTSA